MRDGELKYLPVGRLIELLSRLPEDSHISARTIANTGNLVIHDASLEQSGYIEFGGAGDVELYK